jgi:hypothetical protein
MDQATRSFLSAALREAGAALPGPWLVPLENHFGDRLDWVRLHVGTAAAAAARSLDAEAFTVGTHIFLRGGVPPPGSQSAMWLLAHEVAHALQQRHTRLRVDELMVDPWPELEEEGREAASSFVQGERGLRIRSIVSECSIISRHPGEPCPGPPRWIPASASAPEIYLAANALLEAEYKRTHQNNAVLFGSQFENRDILMPRGTADRALANAILREYRGIARQLRPDIIDFTEHVIYEIKTVSFADAGRAQIEAYYRLIDALVRSHGGPSWNRHNVNWYPNHVYPLPVPGPNPMVICTAATNYGDPRDEGLVLYQVFRRTTPEEEEQMIRRMVAIQEMPRAMEPMRERLQTQLAAQARRLGAGEVWIVASPEFWEHFLTPLMNAEMERQLDLMHVHGLDPRQNPVIGFRNLGWTMVGIYAGMMAILFSAGAAAMVPEAAAGGVALGGAAAGGAASGGGGATVISLAAVRAAQQAAEPIALAAGVLLTISIVDPGTASASPRPVVRSTTSVRAVHPAEVGPQAEYRFGRTVLFGGQTYYIIGRAVIAQ